MMYNSDMGKKKTPYGLDAYRKPYFKGEFRYPQGSKQEAVVIDIDGCIIDWGEKANMELRAWAKKHYDAGRALLIMTARDRWEFTRSFNTLMQVMPYPWTVLITRAPDDPCYAPEYKRLKAEWLSEQYEIVGAADDSRYVNVMWDWWAEEYFEDPADFDLLRTSYSQYKDLPPKGYPKTPVKPYNPAEGYNAYWGSTTVGGAKHRQAGTSFFSDEGREEYVTPWYDQVYNDNLKDLEILDAEVEAAYTERDDKFPKAVKS